MTTKDYTAALDRIYAESGKLHRLVSGPAVGENSQVDTGAEGLQPTYAKVVYDLGVAGDGQVARARNFAGKTDDFVEDGVNSARSWAEGGSGAGQPVGGDAKSWATRLGAAVASGLYSAREWAVGSFTRGKPGGGSARDWAGYIGGTVDDASYSAKKYAGDSALSASGAASSASSASASAASAATAAADVSGISAASLFTAAVTDLGSIADMPAHIYDLGSLI